MSMVIVFFMSRHCDIVICSPLLLNGYYIVHLSPKARSCIHLTKTLPKHGGNYGSCTKAVTLSHTAHFTRTVLAVFTYLKTKLVSF